MGLGIYLAARPTNSSRDLNVIGEAILRAIPDHYLRGLAQVTERDDRLFVSLHPVEEDVELWWNEDGLLQCSARTSSCGPGYHAFLVQLLRAVGASLRLDWIVDAEEYMDETNYWNTGSFDDLQREMIHWLRAVAGNILEQKGSSNFMLSLPVGFPAIHGERESVMTALGFRDRQWLESAAAEEDEAWGAATAHFPWWNEAIDALFWKRYALALSWTELNWNVPYHDKERTSYESAAVAFARARNLEPTISLPEEVIEEIDGLLADEPIWNSATATDTSRIGYFRHPMRRSLTGPWSLVCPGYFHQGSEDDNTTTLYWDDEITIRGTSWSWESQNPRSAREVVGEPPAAREEGCEILDNLNDDPPGWATIARTAEEGETYWVLQGKRGHPTGLCTITIAFDNFSDREAAIAIWESVKCAASASS